MDPLSNATVRHLQALVELPDTSGTRYDVVEPIARGGMGIVYRAHDRELNRDVALKVLSVRETGDEVRARLLTEAHILAHLEHPGIVPVHDVGVLADGRTYYAMKLVRGSSLADYARAHPERGELLRVFGRVCEAVAFAHARGIVHRDLKPENIMVGAYGEVLVMDWGVAKLLGSANGSPQAPGTVAPGGAPVTASGTVVGTPGFMPPEQERGDSTCVDARSDVFALGRLLEVLVGADGSPAPGRLRAIVARATASDPASRYPDADSLAADVTRFSTGQAVSAYRESWWERGRRLALRHRVAITLVSAYVLMRVLIFLVNRF